MGYEKIITYILEEESGTSLLAAGWKFEAIAGGGNWSRPSRPRNTTAPTVPKKRYSKILKAKE
ncbi:MAG: XF1762 family protein, partial [Lachnospiraceae bacterium]|nr:XF1762 family protein [Lachnospiraceae bacterium]